MATPDDVAVSIPPTSTTPAKTSAKPPSHAPGQHSEFLPTAIVGGEDLTRSTPVFSRDAKYVFCCCANVVRVFVKATGAALRDLRGHTDVVTSVVCHPKNRFQIFSSSVDNTIILWDFEDGLLLNRFSIDVTLASKDGLYGRIAPGILGLYLPIGAMEDSSNIHPPP